MVFIATELIIILKLFQVGVSLYIFLLKIDLIIKFICSPPSQIQNLQACRVVTPVILLVFPVHNA